MAEKKTIELEVKTDSVKSLKTQLREAQQEVQTLSDKFGATSKEAINAAKKAGELKDAIGDAKALTDAFNPDAKFNALTSSLSGVASGFGAIEGAMGLMGNESEELQKSLLKVQSAMALSQSLQQIGEARDSFLQLGAVIKNKLITAFSSLKSALISTGIGLFVIAIGVLIANFDKLKNVVSENTANAQKFADSTRLEGEAARATANDFAEYERTLKRLGYAEDEIRKKRGDKLKQAISSTEREIDANKKLYKEQLKNLETVYSYDKLGLNATGRALYGSEEDAAKTREYIKGLRKDLEKLKNDQFDLQQKEKDAQLESEKSKEKVVKTNKEKKESNEDYYQDYLNKLDMQKSEELGLDDFLLEEKKVNNEKDLLEEEAHSEALIKAWEYQAAENLRIEKEKEAAKKILRQQEVNAVQDTFTTIANLAELFAGKSRKQQKAAFQIQKAANIANATIDTYKAAQGAYASLSSIPVIGVGLGIAAAAAATSAGLLNVKRIASQQFGSTSASNSGGGSSPNISAGSNASTTQSVIAPKFNIGGNSTNQLNTLQQQPIQAYVVSGEVTSAQALDRNKIKNATF